MRKNAHFDSKMSKICSKKLKAHCQILIILTTTISFLGKNVRFSLYKVFKSTYKILKQKLADDVGFVWDSTELRPR